MNRAPAGFAAGLTEKKKSVMNILVTGGAGYIGSVLVPMLLERGYHTTVLDKLMFSGDGLLGCFAYPEFTFVRGDITQEDVLARCLEGQDLIIHLAAYVGYPICKKFPEEAERTNLHASLKLNELRGSTPILFGSTGSNYGIVEGEICTEETPLNPITLYGQTKTRAEQAFHRSGESVCYRFATAFGVSPRMRLDLLVNDFCYRAQRLKSLIVYEAHFRRTFIHVRDIARSFLFAIDHYDQMKNNIYNVGSNEMNYTKEQIARKIQEKTRYYLHFAEIGSDEDKRDYEVSYDKIHRLGYETAVDLEHGLNELLQVMDMIDIRNPYSNV